MFRCKQWPLKLLLLGVLLGQLCLGINPEDEETEKTQRKTPSPSMGKELKQFGEQVVFGIDRLIKKKSFDLFGDPWTIQGIPLIFHAPVTGFHLGVLFVMDDIARQDPYAFHIEGQILGTDKGRQKHFFKIDYPFALDGKYRITSKFAYDRDITLRYFGIGNETVVDPQLIQRDDVLYKNVRSVPNLTFQILRRLGANWRIGPTLGFKWAKIEAPAGSLLQIERPTGLHGGATHHIGVAIIRDTLDFEPYPSRGSWHELYLNYSTPWVGSDYDFLRATYIYRQYYPLHRRLTLAHRFLLEAFAGDVPFYELGGIGGSDPTLGFGPDKYLRGFYQNQYIDNVRSVFGVELRWDPIRFNFARQDLTIGFVPFADIGRVWHHFGQVFDNPLPIHASLGVGARVIWNSRFVVRADFATSVEGTRIVAEFGNSF